jgi:hypothetical protein
MGLLGSAERCSAPGHRVGREDHQLPDRVSLSIARRNRHVPVDFELHLRESWTGDPALDDAVGVDPETVVSLLDARGRCRFDQASAGPGAAGGGPPRLSPLHLAKGAQVETITRRL